MNIAIPKKGSRKIVVNGENYRWRFRNGYEGELFRGWGVSFAVEKLEHGHCDLHVSLYMFNPPSDPRNFDWDIQNVRDPLIITPKLVAQVIEIELEKGWQPEQKGGTFELSLNSEEHNF